MKQAIIIPLHGSIDNNLKVALAWLLAHPARIFPIIGSNDLARISNAQGALQLHMTRASWFKILEASRGFCVA